MTFQLPLPRSSPSTSGYIPDQPPRLTDAHTVVIDTETTGLKWWTGHRPLGIAVAWKDGQRWETRYLGFGHAGGNLDEAAVKEWARRELRSKLLVGHNAKFDNHMLYEWGIDLEAQDCAWVDTGHLAALLDDLRAKPWAGHPPQGFSLNAIARDYLGEEHQKVKLGTDIRKLTEVHAALVASYARQDALLTGMLHEAMMPSIVDQDLERVLSLESRCIYPTCELERNPTLLDVELLLAWEKDTKEKLYDYEQSIKREIGLQFKDSPKGWRTLFDKLQIPYPEITVTDKHGKKFKRVGFTSNALEAYLDHPIVALATKIKGLESMRSKFIVKYIEGLDGLRLRTSFHQLLGDEGGTITGRYSSSGYRIDGESIGANLQQVFTGTHRNYKFSNIVGDLYMVKKLFIPDPGNLWFAADAAQIEYRILSHYAADQEILEAYAKDPHLSYHKLVMKMVQEVQPDIAYDNLKTVNFSIIYGAGPDKVAEMLRLPVADVKSLYKLYHQRFPAPGRLMTEAQNTARVRGYIKSILGRRARFPANAVAAKAVKFHKALNSIIQPTAADVMKLKMCDAYAVRKELGFTMRLTVHDELCGDIPDEHMAIELEKVLNEQAIPFRVPILWDAATGPNWNDAKKGAKPEATLTDEQKARVEAMWAKRRLIDKVEPVR